MAKLFWIRTYDRIDNETMQEVFVEPEKKYSLLGEKISFCRICEHWVPEIDLRENCQKGFHELSREIKLDDIEVDDRVGECLSQELEEKPCA